MVVALLTGGCDDPSLAGKDVPSSEVRTVESHGRVLDPQAPPEDVVFVLLQAVREDVQAARDRDKEAAKKALRLEASLAAPEWMYSAYKRNLQRAAMPVEVRPDVAVFKLVRMWAPMLAHYADSFDRDYQAAVQNMLVRHQPDQVEAVVFYDVPTASVDSPATVKVELRKEQEHWRVRRISYSDTSVAALRGRQPTPAAEAPPPTPGAES